MSKLESGTFGSEEKDVLEIDIVRPTLETIDVGQLKEVIAEFVRESFEPVEGEDFNVEDDIVYNFEKAMRLIGENRFYTAMHDGEIVGIISLLQQGNHPDFSGRDIFEITQFYTREKFRGEKINSRLKNRLEEDLLSEYPNYLLISISNKPIVIESLLNKGYKDLEDPERLYEIIITRPNFDPAQKDFVRSWVDGKINDPNMRILIYDPRLN